MGKRHPRDQFTQGNPPARLRIELKDKAGAVIMPEFATKEQLIRAIGPLIAAGGKRNLRLQHFAAQLSAQKAAAAAAPAGKAIMDGGKGKGKR